MCDTPVFRVLTIDGGGMRGLYSASLLYTLAQRFSKLNGRVPDIGKAFNLICGTSTGAILACGLASGIPISEIQDLYIKNGKNIFTRPVSSKHPLLWIVRHLCKPSSQKEPLKNALTKCFGQKTLAELYQDREIATCIAAVNAVNFRPIVFKTPHIEGKHRDNNCTLVDTCLASTAAPIFFPVAMQKDPDNPQRLQYFVDGGMWLNNPILAGLIEALSIIGDKDIPIEIISVGTCSKPSGDPKNVKNPNWGILKWLSGNNIMEISLSSQAFGHTYMAELLKRALEKKGIAVNIIRFEETNKSPEQYSAIGLDKADSMAIQTLLSLAEQDANNIHSISMGKTGYDPVMEIFSKLPLFEEIELSQK